MCSFNYNMINLWRVYYVTFSSSGSSLWAVEKLSLSPLGGALVGLLSLYYRIRIIRRVHSSVVFAAQEALESTILCSHRVHTVIVFSVIGDKWKVVLFAKGNTFRGVTAFLCGFSELSSRGSPRALVTTISAVEFKIAS